MRIYDVDGNLVLLDNKDIRLITWMNRQPYDAFVCASHAASGDESPEYILHRGTISECRDFIAILGANLGGLISPNVSSTKREAGPEPAKQPARDELQF